MSFIMLRHIFTTAYLKLTMRVYYVEPTDFVHPQRMLRHGDFWPKNDGSYYASDEYVIGIYDQMKCPMIPIMTQNLMS